MELEYSDEPITINTDSLTNEELKKIELNKPIAEELSTKLP